MNQKLKDSRLYTFLDKENGTVLYFFEAQKILCDLTLQEAGIHNDLSFFRQSLLSFGPMKAFLKHNESLGLSLEVSEPKFKFRIEISSTGKMRTLLLPKDFNSFPDNFSGTLQSTKVFAHNPNNPYSSVISLENASLNKAVNEFLKTSFQFQGEVLISTQSDQSLLVGKLPEKKEISLSQYLLQKKKDFLPLLEKGFSQEEEIIQGFTQIGLEYLSSSQCELFCFCQKEHFLKILKTMDKKELFPSSDEQTLEINCEYCHKNYSIGKSELE